MPPCYEFCCPNPKCGTIHELLRPVSECRLPAPCPVCGTESPRIMSAGVMFVTNPAVIHNGRLQDPVSHYKQIVEKKKAYKRKYHPLDRREERLEKEAGERRIKVGGGKIFSITKGAI